MRVVFAAAPHIVSVGESLSEFDQALEDLWAGPAVFVLRFGSGEPYLGRTHLLRRRLRRMIGTREKPSPRLLHLRNLVRTVEYWPVASQLEEQLVLYELARTGRPDSYLDYLKLRMPVYVRLMEDLEYPRTALTNRLNGPPRQFYGPFRTRFEAQDFEHRLLDLFQLRRCQEDLAPDPGHPGCVYGEMNLCLRPCQAVVTRTEYASESRRVSDFLQTGGRLSIRSAEEARDRLSADLDFEEAARQHRRGERIAEMMRQRESIAGCASAVSGVTVGRSLETGVVTLWFMLCGAWQPPVAFTIAGSGGRTQSLDSQLRDAAASLAPATLPLRDLQEHLALLSRWYHASWRDGAWLPFESIDKLPYRKLVREISKVAATTIL